MTSSMKEAVSIDAAFFVGIVGMVRIVEELEWLEWLPARVTPVGRGMVGILLKLENVLLIG